MKIFLLVLAVADGLNLPCVLGGFSVSASGFVALIVNMQQENARLLPLEVNSQDTEVAQTPEALTLLQLLQGIDLAGASLPPDALQQRAGSSSSLELQRVCIRSPTAFELLVADTEGSSDDQQRIVPCESAFGALALALRYACPIEVDEAVLDGLCISEEEGERQYPRAYTRADAAKQRSRILKRMAGLPEDHALADGGAAGPPQQPRNLDVQAFDLSSLTPPPEVAPPPPSLNANKPPPGMLKKALAIARDKGDEQAIAKIEAALKEFE